jgi:hypothetical protein
VKPPNEGVEDVDCGAGVRLRLNGDGLVSTAGTDGDCDFVLASSIGVETSVSGSFLMTGSSSRIYFDISTLPKSPILTPLPVARVNRATFALMTIFLSSRSITLETSSLISVGMSNIEIFRPGPRLVRGAGARLILRLGPGVDSRMDLTLILRSSIMSCFSAMAVSTSRSEDCNDWIEGRLRRQLRYAYKAKVSLRIIRLLVDSPDTPI